VDNRLSHPANGATWKDSDKNWPQLQKMLRTLDLALRPMVSIHLATRATHTVHGQYLLCRITCHHGYIWKNQTRLSSPSKVFDVFLQPLVDELLELWKGVHAFDSSSHKVFDLNVVVILSIHDYPILSTLVGRVMEGYYSYVNLDKNPCQRGSRTRYEII
jgi:hypothetical protein